MGDQHSTYCRTRNKMSNDINRLSLITDRMTKSYLQQTDQLTSHLLDSTNKIGLTCVRVLYPTIVTGRMKKYSLNLKVTPS